MAREVFSDRPQVEKGPASTRMAGSLQKAQIPEVRWIWACWWTCQGRWVKRVNRSTPNSIC